MGVGGRVGGWAGEIDGRVGESLRAGVRGTAGVCMGCYMQGRGSLNACTSPCIQERLQEITGLLVSCMHVSHCM